MTPGAVQAAAVGIAEDLRDPGSAPFYRKVCGSGRAG
jgi:hypothetical protein